MSPGSKDKDYRNGSIVSALRALFLKQNAKQKDATAKAARDAFRRRSGGKP